MAAAAPRARAGIGEATWRFIHNSFPADFAALQHISIARFHIVKTHIVI
jgi:hypothetical protein